MELLLILTVCSVVVAIINSFVWYQIGYLEGKKEVSHIVRGEPP